MTEKDEKAMTEINHVRLAVDVLREDIIDFIDESEDCHPSENGRYIQGLKELRTKYRSKVLELQQLQQDDPKYYGTLEMIKASLKQKQTASSKVKDEDEQVKMEIKAQHEKVAEFQLAEITRCIDDLDSTFKRVIIAASDDEITTWNGELLEYQKAMESISEKYQKLLMFPSTNEKFQKLLKAIGDRYELILSSKQVFFQEVKREMLSRELDKKNLTKEARLSINLKKFSGYDSSLDIYTFQNEFEKLHLRTATKRILPSLLINNYLSEPALSLVHGLDDIDHIWTRLKATYGNTKMLLAKKLENLETDTINRIKDPEKLVTRLSRIINTMRDLLSLASKHRIEKELFYGDALDRIYESMGDYRVNKWLEQSVDQDLSERHLWNKLISFLEKEVKVQQQRMMLTISKKPEDSKKQRYPSKSFNAITHSEPLTCYLCGCKAGESDHVITSGPGGSKIVQYFSCKLFADKDPGERFSLLRSKGFCTQCLLPGALSSDPKHKEGRCQSEFSCPNGFHSRFPSKKHILVCHKHRDNQENKDMLEKYRSRCITKFSSLPQFAREIRLSFHVQSCFRVNPVRSDVEDPNVITDRGIYMLQTILLNNKPFTIFYDTGCSDFVLTHDAVLKLGPNAVQESAGPVKIGGVGDVETVSNHGAYRIAIPLCDGNVAKLSGICLEKIASPFPMFQLRDAEKELSTLADGIKLPKLPESIGGNIDLMIGVKYLRYHPKLVFQSQTGLSIYRSCFHSINGTRGVLGGPHRSFSEQFSTNFHFSMGFHAMRSRSVKASDVPLLGNKPHCSDLYRSDECYATSILKPFYEVEGAGSEITYRCTACRECKKCKNHESVEMISLREEAEQALIDSSIKIDLSSRTTTARLPFISNPTTRLAPNKEVAMKVYRQQVKKLSNLPKDRADIIESEAKMQSLGYVDYTKNLPKEIQEQLSNHSIQNYIPWRAVWKPSSISTPCRVVYDASQPTPSGYSLNDVLAKGRNSLNRLQDIFIRWSIHPVGMHTDIRKMYNTVKLDSRDWCYQRYIWQNELDPTKIPEEKVIKTLIYGVKPSGNLAERGLREVAKLSKDEYPEVCEIIEKDVYVDDCVSGEETIQKAKQRADELELSVNRGGYELKGVSFSGEDPPESLSDDGLSICVAGMKWYTKDDTLSLNIGELNFSKRVRGKKSESAVNVIPSKLTRRHCASKVAELFDISGKITPITASLKLDLHELVTRGLQWDDVLPNDLRALWLSNFEMMQELGTIRYRRTIVPEDAVSLELDTIDFGDATQSLACVAIYSRIKRRNGQYHCQLVLARSRIVKDLSQPRAELYAALLNSHTGEIISRSFSKWHKSSIKLCDSQIALYWICNQDKPLKQWVRTRVIDIQRFAPPENWFYVHSSSMLADKGTRQGITIDDVHPDSTWIKGYDWMKRELKDFPIKPVNTLKLSNDEEVEANKEILFKKEFPLMTEVHFTDPCIPSEVLDRYKFSSYLVDPNSHSFSKCVRIMSYVVKFVKSFVKNFKSPDRATIQTRSQKKKLTQMKGAEQSKATLNPDEIKDGENYYFRKCSDEIKQFLPVSKYQRISKEVDGVLLYIGRILPSSEFTFAGRFTKSMKDLSETTFCVPLVDKHSPVAYSLVNDTHWNSKNVRHCGVETTLREVQKKAFIIEGRSLVRKIRKGCQRCRLLAKKTLDVAMGPVSRHNLNVAPAFFVSQVDLSGPFKSYSPHNKRVTVKIWLAVFCCCTTSTTSIKVLDDYSTESFIQSFIRFACDCGFPQKLLCDEGSQLVKGCQDMKLSYQDIKYRLYRDVALEFEVCPVGGHNMHGRVERKIKEINSSIEMSASNERLSILQWETLAAQISNTINDMPIGLGSATADLENLDLLTPNRLRLGRNNDRSPVGEMVYTNQPSKMIAENNRIFTSWFEIWLQSYVPRLMDQVKWYKSDEINKGDIILFLKQESPLSKTYQYGMVDDVEISKDDLIRKVTVKYRNHNEQTTRYTRRSVRSLVMIKPVNEVDISTELGRMACLVDTKKCYC